MSWWKFITTRKITTDRHDVLVTRLVCFACAPPLFYFGIRGVERHATTAGEVTIGVLAVCSVCLLTIVVGLLIPLSCREWWSSETGRST